MVWWYVCAVEIRLEDMGYGYDIPGMRYKRGDREYKKLDAGWIYVCCESKDKRYSLEILYVIYRTRETECLIRDIEWRREMWEIGTYKIKDMDWHYLLWNIG